MEVGDLLGCGAQLEEVCQCGVGLEVYSPGMLPVSSLLQILVHIYQDTVQCMNNFSFYHLGQLNLKYKLALEYLSVHGEYVLLSFVDK